MPEGMTPAQQAAWEKQQRMGENRAQLLKSDQQPPRERRTSTVGGLTGVIRPRDKK